MKFVWFFRLADTHKPYEDGLILAKNRPRNGQENVI